MTALATETEVSRQALANALAAVKDVIPAQTPLPSLKCVLLKTEDGRLTVRASNLETWVRVDAGECEGDLDCLVEHAHFLSVVQNVSAVTLSLEQGAGLRMSWGRSGSKTFPILPGGDFPYVPVPVSEEVVARVDAGELAYMVGQTEYAAPDDATRPSLRCISLSPKDTETLRAIGAGAGAKGALGAYVERPAECVEGWAGATVPRDQAKALRGFLARSTGVVSLHAGDAEVANFLRIRSERDELLLRQQAKEFTFPLEGVLGIFSHAGQAVADFVVEKDAAIRALRIARGTAAQGPFRVSLSLTDEGLRIQAKNADHGESDEVIPAEVAIPGDKRDFNADYLLPAVSRISGERVRFRYIVPGGAAILSAPDSDSEMHTQSSLLPVT